MRPTGNPTPSTAALDYDSTKIGALELSSKKWVFAVQLPGVKKHSRHVVEPNGLALAELIERLKSRAESNGRPIARVIVTHEAGRDGLPSLLMPCSRSILPLENGVPVKPA
ncbi:hypothetical protein [Methylocystis sp.]|uniref:hypothetical protein n=1 Tax=Methylocystis sp. TaxID=1911079 RepID=UPI003DA55F3F